MTIPFHLITREDHWQIMNAAMAATAIAKELGIDYPTIDASMDLSACHVVGCALDLPALNKAFFSEEHRQDFGHDVLGIRRHLDRDTGELRDCFRPRFARKEG